MKNSPKYLAMFLLVTALGTLPSLAADNTDQRGAQAQAYRAGNEPVLANPDGSIIAEAEEFRIGKSAWRASEWGENYYAATFANSFLSRKAFLQAPEQCDTATATIRVNVPAAGRYVVLVRYEATYRFETQFKVKVQQAGKTLLDQLYGARDNVKVWAFKTGKDSSNLKKEVAWDWGAVENTVWEGHNAAVTLAKGIATISLTAGKQPSPAAKRNIDCVLLTTDEAHVKHQLAKATRLPFDGMLTQAGDVWLRVQNKSAAPLTLTVPKCREHSPYWVHIRRWKNVVVAAPAGKTTEWVDVGGLLDTLNDGQWSLTAKGEALDYTVELGLRNAAGKIARIADFAGTASTLNLAYDGDTRYSSQVRDQRHVLRDLMAYLRAQPLRGKRPTLTPIYCETFSKVKGDDAYNAAVDEFISLYNLELTGRDAGAQEGFSRRGFVDVRSVATPDLAAKCIAYGDSAKQIEVVSLGDEIGLKRPSGKTVTEDFRTWLKSEGLTPADVDPTAGGDWEKIVFGPGAAVAKPRLYYWSEKYQNAYGIAAIKERTDIIRKYLPNAGIGANFSPHHGFARQAYIGEVYKWVTLFRKEGMTMPWSEDYIWQLPVGSQQMNFINLDLSRAAIRGMDGMRIHYYVMPHWPGNTPMQWRRQFYGDLGHGMKDVNLFEFRPVQVAYTENHVTHNPMYGEILKSFYELGQFEDIVQKGAVRGGTAALWFSEVSDAWRDNQGSMSAAKRSMYTAILHQQLQLDFVVDQDATDGILAEYKVLYVTDPHLHSASAAAIAAWVKKGGRLLATAGAGMFDEYNQPNKVFRELLGVDQSALEAPAAKQIGYIKQDLPFVDPVDTVTWKHGDRTVAIPAFGACSRFAVKGAEVIGTFSDGTPAISRRAVGTGTAIYCGFLPSLSYYKPATPARPVDRGSSDASFSHFIPTAFDANASALIALPAAGVARQVTCSNPLVEAKIIQHKEGSVITLVNWSDGPVEDLTVTVNVRTRSSKAYLASGAPVTVVSKKKPAVFSLSLDVADALVLP